MSRIAPRLVSVLVRGDELDAFADAAPTSHLKVFLPAPGQDEPLLPEFLPEGQAIPDDARPSVRTYTPRRFDAATGTLEIQFVLHGAGPASDWAERVSAGDKLAVAGPGGRFVMDADAERWWIAGDESAIPAVATLLEALPAAAAAEVHLEVADADDEVEFASQAKTEITWHHRRTPTPSAPSSTKPRAAPRSPTAPRSGWPARPRRCAASADTSSAAGASRPAR